MGRSHRAQRHRSSRRASPSHSPLALMPNTRSGALAFPAGVLAPQPEQQAVFHAQREQFERLLDRLLDIGGHRLVIPLVPDLDLPALLGPHARSFSGRRARLVPGRPRECHANTAELWRAGIAQITTGYALAADGLWRQHSWGLEALSARVVETTVLCERYFGVALAGQGAADFAQANTY